MLACGAGTLILFLLFRSLRHDDAYITFQFARNLARGDGFAFNVGEPILGTTSPLSALLLAAFYAVFGDAIPETAVLLGAAALTAQTVLVYLLLRETSRGFAALAAALIWLGWAGAHAWLALETNLVAGFALAMLWCLQQRRETLAGLFLGLAFLSRYDAALLVPIVVAGQWLRTRTLPLRMLAVAGAVVLPWLVFATLYFGSPLPNTFAAKQRLTESSAYARHYLAHFAAQPWLGLGMRIPFEFASPLLWILGLAALPRLVGSRIIEFIAYGLLLFAAYTRIGPPSGHHWHLYPSALVFNLLALVGVVEIFDWLRKRFPSQQRAAHAIATTVAVAMIGFAAAQALRFAHDLPEEFWFGARHRRYAAIAAWTAEHVQPGRSFLAVEVGTLGYLSGLRMIDASGLINASNDFPRTQALPAYIDLVRRFQPDLVLAQTADEARAIAQATGYRVVHRFEWKEPWATLLARSPDVLIDPATVLQDPAIRDGVVTPSATTRE